MTLPMCDEIEVSEKKLLIYNIKSGEKLEELLDQSAEICRSEKCDVQLRFHDFDLIVNESSVLHGFVKKYQSAGKIAKQVKNLDTHNNIRVTLTL